MMHTRSRLPSIVLLPAVLLSAVLLSVAACRAATSDQGVAAPTPTQTAVMSATQPAPHDAPTRAAQTAPAAAHTDAPPVTAVRPTQAAARVPTMSPTQLPLINVDSMMGYFPQQTVFVATHRHVSAVTLLNHFTRYQVPTNGVAQVTVARTGQRLYVLDLDADQPGTHQLRLFDAGSGDQLAVQGGIADVMADQRALSTAFDGRALVLKSDAARTWVDAYDALSLAPLGVVMEKSGCGDRLLATVSRIAIVCFSSGEIELGGLRGDHASVPGAPRDLVAAAVAADGTLYAASADRQLVVVRAAATNLESMPWPDEWAGAVLVDGLAFAPEQASVVIVQARDNVAWVRVLPLTSRLRPTSFPLAGVPHGGILTLFPFAYYTVANTVYHVDLTSGLLETMAEVGADAIPVAVVNG